MTPEEKRKSSVLRYSFFLLLFAVLPFLPPFLFFFTIEPYGSLDPQADAKLAGMTLNF